MALHNQKHIEETLKANDIRVKNEPQEEKMEIDQQYKAINLSQNMIMHDNKVSGKNLIVVNLSILINV